MSPRPRSPLERLPHAIAEQVVRRIVELLDVNEIIERVDVDEVVRRVDVNALLERVDLDALLERVDVDEVVDRVDVDRLMARVDLDAIVARIDVNAIADRIDVEALVRRADLGPLIAQSTTGMVGEFVALLRRQIVTGDDLLDLVSLRTRKPREPKGPPALQGPTHAGRATREGQWAGGLTRLVANLADVAAGWGIFALLALGVDAAAGLLAGTSFSLLHERLAGLVCAVVFGFLYFTSGWALSGRTIGLAVVGARVTAADGGRVTWRAAAIRTLVLPFSIALAPIGLSGILYRTDRRALHDLAAGTCVVYHWEARADAALARLERLSSSSAGSPPS